MKPIISTQVINENINVCLRKLKLSKEDAFQHAENLIFKSHLVLITEQTIKNSFSVSKEYGYSYFDSLIIASALENGCSTLYSEDLQHMQKIYTLKIVNPFINETN